LDFVCCARYARTAEAVSNQDDLVTSAFGESSGSAWPHGLGCLRRE
jgi:hypothetical protein